MMLVLGLVPLLVLPSPAQACGPFFPHSLLASSPDTLLSGPHGDLGLRLRTLDKELGLQEGVIGSPLGTSEAEETLARDELTGASPGLLADLQEFRRQLDRARLGRGPVPELPAGLPPLWARYAEAARLLAADDSDAALPLFLALAAEPAATAGSRGLWAAHMAGRLTGDAEHFADVRARVAAGAPDPLGLSAAGLGWEALERWDAGDSAGALRRYARQSLAGDPTGRPSLERRLQALWGDPARRDAALADPVAAEIVAAWMVTGKPTAAARSSWLAQPASRTAAPETQAWTAWLARDLPRLEQALAEAPDTPIAHWLHARLAMLQGDTTAALAHLEHARFSPDQAWTCHWGSRQELELGEAPIHPAREVASEQGALLLQSGDIAGALDAFALAGNWLDTAHVADRVATLDELRTAMQGDLLERLNPHQQRDMKALFARRLARAGAWEEARDWHREERAPVIDALLVAQSADTAAGTWEAAQIVRRNGMELLGTELGPDSAWFGGSYAVDLGQRRADGLLAPGAEEAQRVAQSAPTPDRRFHYRYRAAELAWQAAARTPAGDPAAPRMLCLAGRWLMYLDPPAADRFYKEMVWRAWGTPLGRTADELRWFPSAEECAVETPPETAPDPGLWDRLLGWLRA